MTINKHDSPRHKHVYIHCFYESPKHKDTKTKQTASIASRQWEYLHLLIPTNLLASPLSNPFLRPSSQSSPVTLRNQSSLSTGIDWQLNSINHLTNRRPPNATANDEPARTRDDTTVATFDTSERHSYLPGMPQDMPPRGGYEPVQYKVRWKFTGVQLGRCLV
jgi:hypothetical protein